ncbi:glycogen debranching protein GlgX [Schaalia sp. lx-100]|uniref:glycogen debranching protein GlgX n=1 Tax=Schaalia sp. lx-100 TaxID=2899081 RepID=UPI001E538D36|nr:glycogen debranching protein GlgX [Schaalia sp. lx-100]MCD4557956.1 glycogen debranching protein GlgX [Schaalia sp. lx-100]
MSSQHQSAPQRAHAEHPEPRRIGVFVENNSLVVSVIARHATHMLFCVINEDGTETQWALYGPDCGIWHGRIDGYGAGTRYGFRAQGPWDPDAGLYYNPHKLLLDPRARGLEGSVNLSPYIYPHRVDEDLYPVALPMEMSTLDSAGHVPLSVVVDTHFDIAPKPRVPWGKTVIYEMHVKGFTKDMPSVPEQLRGTYAGLAHPSCVDYLKKLGITTIELLPIHAKCDEPFLAERGLTNYWGYSTLSFFAPEPTYATVEAQKRGAQGVIDEFRGMVSILHQAGIEVILDVVYNHTCEGGKTGPSLSWRGLDQGLYYRQTPHRPREQVDTTGCGNTVNVDHPQTMAMILDSLRHWSLNMGIDGFRFDLATVLGRFNWGYTPLHPLLMAIATDERLSLDKMIAEPWDVGPGGWQTGNFPDPFSEWNDQFRGVVRSFWLSDVANLSKGLPVSGPNDLATRLSGSQDVFSHGTGYLRGPRASINFVTAHDGFTLADLTAFDHKHNQANLEENRDGSDDNRSWNHGLEGGLASDEESLLSDVGDGTGLTDDLRPMRHRSQRNLLTTMLISAGTPMITAGDEFQRTQYGNNNAYCQDSPISWVNWNHRPAQKNQILTTRWLLNLRKNHPVLRPWTFATGTVTSGDSIEDLSWYNAHGQPILQDAWYQIENRTFQMLRSGFPFDDRDALVIINGTLNDRDITLPIGHDVDWRIVMDTSWESPIDGGIDAEADWDGLPLDLELVSSRTTLNIEPLSMMVLLSDVVCSLDSTQEF